MSYNYNGNYQGCNNVYDNNYDLNNMRNNMQFSNMNMNRYPHNYSNVINNLDGFPAFFVDSYEQVRQSSVAADGTPSIFISNTEDRFWLKKTNTETGRTIVKNFIFSEDTEEQCKNNSVLQQNVDNKAISKEEVNKILIPIVEDLKLIKDAIFGDTKESNSNEGIKKINI